MTCAIPVSLFRFSAGWVRLCCDRPEPDMGRAKVQFLGLESGGPEIGAIVHRAEIGADLDQSVAAAHFAGPFPDISDHVVQDEAVTLKSTTRRQTDLALLAGVTGVRGDTGRGKGGQES